MPVGTDDLTWININDFTPGIRNREFGDITLGGSAATGSSQVLGAASESGTFGCMAMPDGGLGPLPQLALAQTHTAIDPTPASRVEAAKYRVTGFHIAGPVNVAGYPGKPPVSTAFDDVEAHIAFEWLFDSDSNGSYDQRKFRWSRIRLWEVAPTIDSIFVLTSAEATPGAFYRRSPLVDCRMDPTTPTNGGYPLVGCAWYAGGGGFENRWMTFPDPAALGVTGVKSISTTNPIDHLIQHQGRLVGFASFGRQRGAVGFMYADESAFWTNVNLPTLASAVESNFGQGEVTGFGAALSASAQELTIIKHRGGGLSVIGDITSPTITALPGLTSTQGARALPCFSPLGMIYGVKGGGVYAYAGGGKSQLLSPNLRDDFWRSTWTLTNGIIGNDGKFAAWGDWVMCPDGWIYDTITKGWWRIEDMSQAANNGAHFYWSASPNGNKCYSAPQTWDGVAGTTLIRGYDKANVATSWQWTSNYIAPSQSRLVEIREITLEAIAGQSQNDSVAVTLTNESGVAVTETFSSIGERSSPKRRRITTLLQGTSFKVKMVATGGRAPTVFNIGLGWRELQQVPATGL